MSNQNEELNNDVNNEEVDRSDGTSRSDGTDQNLEANEPGGNVCTACEG